MPDMWEELEAFEADEDPEPTGEPATDAASGSEPEDEGVLGTGLTLEDLMASDSKFVSEFAKELAGLKQAQAERQARENAARQAEEAAASGEVNWDDAEVRAQMLLLVEKRRQEASVLFEAGMRRSLKAQKLSDQAIEDALVEERAANEVALSALGEPTLFELPEYRAHVQEKREIERARATAIELRDRTNLGYEAEMESAESGIDEALEQAISAP